MANIVEQISDAFRGQRTQAFLSDGTDNVLFNVTLTTTETDTNEVTSHSVEQGADITDHIIEKPKQFSFNAVLSDNDISIINPSSYFEESIEDRKKILDKWLTNKTLLTYYGHETDIENVVMESITRNKTRDVGEGLGLDIKIRQINIVESTTVDIDITLITKKGKTAKKNQSSKAEASTEAAKKKSWVTRLFGSDIQNDVL
jgi:hypothetical protein